MAKTVSDLTHTGQVNSFTGGLNTDLHPLVQPNDTLTDCINGTLITYNGNENMLQNDMGNYALEGSELPDGFIPLGMKEHNGVAYIVSHNPMTKEVQIGSYPSPEIINTEKDPQSLKSEPIPMTHIDSEDYSYDRCVYTWCVESRKVSETQYTKFDVELNFGDSYAISPMENLDFQYEQFAIKEKSGKITNINPIVDDKMHTVDWTSCGQLLKKYVLNKVTNFTQEVDWQVFEGSKTRIVGGLPEDEHIYPDEDLQSITIKNTVKFDRIDVVREDNDEVLVGVVHKIITGNPKAFANDSDRKPRESYTKTHNILETTNFDGNTEYKFTTNISSNGFLYFLRKWIELEGDKIVRSAYVGPIEIQSYPILIHRVNGEDKSVLLYDESGKQTFISELDIKGDFIYQYYVTTSTFTTPESGTVETIKRLHLKLDGPNKDENFFATRYILQDDGNLSAWDNENTLIFYKDNKDVNSSYWEGGLQLPTEDSIFFFGTKILNNYYIFPVFTSIDQTAYEKYALKYNNFCLIPGDQLLQLHIEDKEHIKIDGNVSTKYIKLTDKFEIHDKPFNTSIYLYDNNDTYYGDVECADIIINNYSGNKVTIELQKQNEDESWTTLQKQTATVTNGTARFSDCIVSANIQKAVEGESVDKCVERIYLAKIGHAPFAHSEDANKRTYNDWTQRFCENTGFDSKLLEKLIKYGDWENKKSLYLGKHCGPTNNDFVVTECDIYGNSKDGASHTHATTEGWKTEFVDEQLFMPVTFNVDCRTAKMSIWVYKGHTFSERYDRYHTSFTNILARTNTIPFLISHVSQAFTINGSEQKPEYTLFDKWLLYLYTHAFCYKEVVSSGQNFILIDNNNHKENFRYIVKGDFDTSIIINDKIFNFNSKNKNNLLRQLNMRCKNFDFIIKIINHEEYNVVEFNSNTQWDTIQQYKNVVKIDSSIAEYNTLFCDVFDDKWTVVKWGENFNDANYNFWQNNIDNCDIDKSVYFPKGEYKMDILRTAGKRSLYVVLAQMLGTVGLTEQNINIQEYTNDILNYDFSPEFKRIIDYGTEN